MAQSYYLLVMALLCSTASAADGTEVGKTLLDIIKGIISSDQASLVLKAVLVGVIALGLLGGVFWYKWYQAKQRRDNADRAADRDDRENRDDNADTGNQANDDADSLRDQLRG